MLDKFIPILKAEHNKIHTILKLITAIEKRCDFVDVRESFANTTNSKYINNYERKTLKSFNMFRNMLIHQETHNVLKSEHWTEIHENMTNVFNIINRLLNEFETPLEKKINDVTHRYEYDSGFGELNDWLDSELAKKEFQKSFHIA